MARVLFGVVALSILAAATMAGLGLWGYNRFHAPGPSAAETTVVIPRGASLAEIGERLYEAGVVDNPTLFQLGARLLARDRGVQAGEYSFPARASAGDALAAIIEGRTLKRRFTVAEGLSVAAVIALVATADGLAGELPPDIGQLAEGSLLPDTYFFSLGDRRADIVLRMAAAMRETLAELWTLRASGLPLDGPEEVTILASIVEKETGVPAERPRIARVFLNRLSRGIALQSDPTVIYALTQGKMELGRALTRADLAAESPYNTYINPGLPPGPIGNPGRAALEAVLHPAEGAELYFVADGSGGHAFAATLAEHNRNVAKWRELQAQ